MSIAGSRVEASYRRLWMYLRTHTNPWVFLPSTGVVVAFLVAGVCFADATNTAAQGALDFIATYFRWFYILAATFFLVFVIALMISKYGRLRLGPDNSRPEYRTLPWFAMLFTTGMGIGLVFFGAYEPAFHLLNAPTITGADQQAANEAMKYTLYHWGLHPWAIYIVSGLGIGFFCFRKGLPLRPCSALYPLIGKRIYGWPGHLIDVLAVFATLFGLATSLGLGARQVNAGLEEMFEVPANAYVQVAIISLITAIAVASVMFGIDRGIRRLSMANLALAFVLIAFVFAVGPMRAILNGLADYPVYYLQNLSTTSVKVFDPQVQDSAARWQANWTIFYWGWWMSWSPFVGMFIARISYGRTIRQFIAGTLLAPAGVSVVWFAVLGGSALAYQQDGTVEIARAGDLSDDPLPPARALFVFLRALPIDTVFVVVVVAAMLAILVAILFFATSSDSASLVVDMLTNGNDPNPVKLQLFFWAVAEGAIAAVLLVVDGPALEALRAASITAGLPFALVLVLMCVSLMLGLVKPPAPQ